MRIKQFGVTPPLSDRFPLPHETQLNTALVDELSRQGSFESPLESQRRIVVLGLLQTLTLRLVQLVGRMHRMPDDRLATAGGKIFTFGSYQMGVHGPGSDIDTLVVGPSFVTRFEFFDIFPDLLRELPQTESIIAIPEAFVPVLKVKISGISVDLIFASLNVPQVPLDFSLEDESLLYDLDDKDLRAVNGTRVTNEILRLVPDAIVFRFALRAIKLWARRRAIYGNIMGFPGGVAWAMLVARVCQLYPNANAAIIVCKFFDVMVPWDWPKPVLLKPLEARKRHLRVWNPRVNIHDRSHRMPVITPAYPPMCSTHNITSSTQQVIISELKNGQAVAREVLRGRAPWKDFFAQSPFFRQYKYYLAVEATTTGTLEEHLQWSGLIQSKVRLLVQKLEALDTIKISHPYIKTFDKSYLCSEKDAQHVAQGETVENLCVVPPDTGVSSEPGKVIVHTTTLYVGLELWSGLTKRLDIKHPCQDFFDACKAYYHPHCTIFIKHLRGNALPPEVFEDDELDTLGSVATATMTDLSSDDALPKARKLSNTSLALSVASTDKLSRKPLEDKNRNSLNSIDGLCKPVEETTEKLEQLSL